MSKKRDTEITVEALVASGVKVIRQTWMRIRSKELRGAYGRQSILETIYQVYLGWDPVQQRRIRRWLAERIPQQPGSAPHVLQLLIRAALPQVELQVTRYWTDAIRYREACNVRAFKLRGFLYAKGGLVRCAKEFRQLEAERIQREKEQREDEAYERRAVLAPCSGSIRSTPSHRFRRVTGPGCSGWPSCRSASSSSR